MRKIILLALSLCAGTMSLWAQKTYSLKSPDGTIATSITAGSTLTYQVTVDGNTVIAPSALSMTLSTGSVWGQNVKVKKATRSSVNTTVASPFYRASSITDNYNAITLQCSGSYDVEFRAYNNGVAYRFVNHLKKPFEIVNEGVEYCMSADHVCTAPYVINFNPKKPDEQFVSSFENINTTCRLSELNQQRYCFLPLSVSTGKVRLAITESDLENYPGLYLHASGNNTLSGVFAPYPKDLKQGGHNMLEMEILSRESYIAKVKAPRSFPWRIAMIGRTDTDIANNSLSYLLSAPSRVADISWIRPGKVAWDWWNTWTIAGVDFEAGVNTATYKHYIDFAHEHGIEYVILDEGWAVNLQADLLQVVPEIDMKELVDYGKSQNVGIILWAGYWAMDRDMENVCRHYSEMGVKGFKVDFMDRDDQIMTDFFYRCAATAAKYHLIIDFHGAYKPAGLTRTYPNVLNFEGVYGLEQLRDCRNNHDQLTYDCEIPFTRQVAGPLDYTQGAMLNCIKGHHLSSYMIPASQGTRCHQLGLYMVFDSPLSMLCDSPTNYRTLGGPCTDFIAQVPTVWDETRVIAGEMGKYVVTARRKADTWYVGGITNWDARDITINTAQLGIGACTMDIFKDGANAHRRASDYKYLTNQTVASGQAINIHMAPGGGFAVILKPAK